MTTSPDDQEISSQFPGYVGYPADNGADFNVNVALGPRRLQQPCEFSSGLVDYMASPFRRQAIIRQTGIERGNHVNHAEGCAKLRGQPARPAQDVAALRSKIDGTGNATRLCQYARHRIRCMSRRP